MENRLMQIPSPIIVRLKELDELVAENPEYIPIPAAEKNYGEENKVMAAREVILKKAYEMALHNKDCYEAGFTFKAKPECEAEYKEAAEKADHRGDFSKR